MDEWTIVDPALGATVDWIGGYLASEEEAHEQVQVEHRMAVRQIELTEASDGLRPEWAALQKAQAEIYYAGLSIRPLTDEQREIDGEPAPVKSARRAQLRLARLNDQVADARAERLRAVTALYDSGISAYRIAKILRLSQVQVARILK